MLKSYTTSGMLHCACCVLVLMFVRSPLSWVQSPYTFFWPDPPRHMYCINSIDYFAEMIYRFCTGDLGV